MLIGLRCQLNILMESANKLSLTVNLKKSKIIVFRNGGPLSRWERWFYNGTQLQIVHQYKYLGVIFSSGLSFSYAFEDMVLRAKKGIIGILRLLWKIGDHSPELFFKLFDCQIQPILLYGSEIWAPMCNLYAIEKVHLFALKRFLNVNTCTPTLLIYSECGRYPLFVNAYVRSIKFWLKTLSLNESRLSLKAYKMLYAMQNGNIKNWTTNVRHILYRYGFGFAWEAQGVGDMQMFMRIFKQRLVDNYRQEWEGAIKESERYTFYAQFKCDLNPSLYVLQIKNIYIRRMLSKFRLGVSPINTHYYRFQPTRLNCICPFCPNCLENEIHFLLICKKYQDLRNECIPRKYWTIPSEYKVILLLANERLTWKVALYLYKSFNIRASCQS